MIVLLMAAKRLRRGHPLLLPPFGLGLEVAERLIPEAVEVAPDGRDAVQVDAVDAPRSFRPLADEACVLQHAQVLGDGRSADGELTSQFSDGHRPPGEPLEDRSPSRVAEGVHRYRKLPLTVSVRYDKWMSSLGVPASRSRSSRFRIALRVADEASVRADHAVAGSTIGIGLRS